ncbi:putative nuclease HARBI1 [Ruditapes philippinarum]|uniref:putative nuclease HARBI1 n=1 Tax=Ruditapes philippinarum TaxID=129788 RepID=UPI00295AFA7A|nr:putative nuclease HARBI1 [Ruditapes philippinarum]
MALSRRVHLRRRRDKRVFRKRFSLDDMDDGELRKRYRFSKASILYIFAIVERFLSRSTRRSQSVPPMLQLLTALRFFATGSFMRLVGDSTGLSESSVSRCVITVAKALVSAAKEFIHMPSASQTRVTKEKFYRISKFPNVIGAVDCTHVKIQAPTNNESDFVNRKGFHSINVQMVCDAEFKFLNCVAEWPGCTHDARVFRNSKLCESLENGQYDGLLVGDSAYPCRPFLMTPYNQPSDEKERKFNSALCRARVLIEQSFGILKRRFPCLQVGLRMLPERAALVTMACVVLHNIAMQRDEPLDDTGEVDIGNDASNVSLPEHNDGSGIRQHLCQNFF